MSRRAAGILLHPTLLPGSYGIGDLGPEAERFLDWAALAGQSIWQVLPLGPTSVGNSPYVSQSLFAGNPLFISPERLVEDGLLARAALDGAPLFPEERVDFDAVTSWKEEMLRAAWERFRAHAPSGVRESWLEFRSAPEQRAWLPGWTLFAALKAQLAGTAWIDWDPALRRREPSALDRAREALRDEIEYHEFVQFVFDRQWRRLHEAARARGIAIFGDTPIYVALDSADVWESPQYFQLDS